MTRLCRLLEKKYTRHPLTMDELIELKTLLHKEYGDTHETIALRKFSCLRKRKIEA